MSGAVKVGMQLAGINPKFWPAASQAAEAAGFESVWVPEHLVLPVQMSGSPHTGHPEPPIPPSMPAFDAFVALGMIASTTSNIRLGTNVYNIGLRHPFVTARAVTTLDALSGGRVELGIGSSWLREEWEVTQLDFHTRGRRVNEAIDICRRLWSDDVVEHHGEFFEFQPVMFAPKPLQQPLPILVGGDAAASMRRAALLGDGWLPMNHALEDLPGAFARDQRHARGSRTRRNDDLDRRTEREDPRRPRAVPRRRRAPRDRDAVYVVTRSARRDQALRRRGARAGALRRRSGAVVGDRDGEAESTRHLGREMVTEHVDVPLETVATLRSVCLGLPEAYEEPAWVGTRWRVRTRTFAHVLRVDSGWPPAYARAAGTDGPTTVMTFRSAGAELAALSEAGHPFFKPRWRRDEVGMVLDAGVDWDEVAELLTESYCVVAPQKLVALVDRAPD